MSETLKRIQIGESYETLTPARQQNDDGSTFVGDEAGGIVLQPIKITVLEIIDRPQNDKEAVQLANTIWDRIMLKNQSLVDGKLVSEDNPRLSPKFDPTKFYVVEE